MKLWTKIILGGQLLFILFLVIFARIKAAEAEKQTIVAQVQSEIAMQAQQEAEKQAELAAQAMAIAHAAEQEARNQAELAQAQLERCISKK